MLSSVLVPVAQSAATTSAAPDRMSGTVTDAPCNWLGAATLDVNVGPELAQFQYVLEAVLEDRLGDDTFPVRLRHQADEGRLQVGGESGVWAGGDVDRLQPAVALYPETVRLILHLDAGLAQLQHHGPEIRGRDVFEDCLAAGGRNREGVGTRLDVVGDDAMGRTAELGHALDLQHIGANSVDLSAHLAEEHRQVDDMRLTGGVVDGGKAVGGSGGHHQVLSAGNSRHVEMDSCTFQTVSPRDILAVHKLDMGAHQTQTVEVLLDAAHADVIPTWLRHPRLASPGQQRTD